MRDADVTRVVAALRSVLAGAGPQRARQVS
jgi:hypothetical protein